MVTIQDVFEELLPYTGHTNRYLSEQQGNGNESFSLYAYRANVEMSRGSFAAAKEILDQWLQRRREEVLEEMSRVGLEEWVLPPNAFERKITVAEVMEATQQNTLRAAQLNYIRVLALRRALD